MSNLREAITHYTHALRIAERMGNRYAVREYKRIIAELKAQLTGR